MKTFAALALSLGAAITWVAPTLAEEKFPGIENLMSTGEFKDAGLHQLSDRELEKLNTWLVNYTAGHAQVLVRTNEEVKEAKATVASDIVTRLQGDFTGWSGDTLFRMENGQVWRQRLSGRYKYSGPPNPEVRISRNFMGFYKMTLTESGKSIGVRLAD